MLFISIAVALLIVYLLQARIFSRHSFDGVEYRVTLSAEEVFEGEDIFLYEEIANCKSLPVPNIKVDTELPEGLEFVLTDRSEKRRRIRRDFQRRSVQSIFVLGSHKKVRRRWRVRCTRRGVYHPGAVMMITNDLLGFNAQSKRFEVEPSKFNRVVVLPRAEDLDEHFTSSVYNAGEVTAQRSLFPDPLRIAGAREYTPLDPMNRINWKSTAHHDRLMVNIEEYTMRHSFNIVMNMQSRDIEHDPTIPSNADYIEMCISVAASILDRISPENVPVRLFANTPPESVGEAAISEDEIGSRILITRPFTGREDMLTALRLLAAIQMKVSVPIEKMLDHIAAHAESYASGGNIIIVSPYVSERMLVFHEVLKAQGVKVIFYVTTTNQNAAVIPPDVEVYFRTF